MGESLNKNDPAYKEAKSYLSLIFKIGLNMVLSIILGFSIGLFIERRISLNGAGVLAGVIFGLIIGFYLMYKQIVLMQKNMKGKSNDT